MSDVPQLGCQSDKPQESINWKLCILCQADTKTKGLLVLHPRAASYHHLLEVIKERSSLHDVECVKIQRRLKETTEEMLQAANAVWHRTCYSNATNKVQVSRDTNREQYALSTGSHFGKQRGRKRKRLEIDEPSTSSESPFTRSSTLPLNKNLCFFCQMDDSQEELSKVSTKNAGDALKNAVEASQNAVFRTRLNTSISTSDAHAIDIRYHKSCWTKHVFHVLRDEDTKANKQTSDCSMQIVSLIELINLIDIQTQNKAYLSMDDIEMTYVNMLGGVEALESHVPTFTRKWLKDKILSELPNVKSVLQPNRRKSAVLYSPEACEEGMVHTAITSNDMDEMKFIYKSAQQVRRSIDDFTNKDKPDNTIPVSSNIDDVPVELYTLIRWIMVGPADELENKARTSVVERAVLTVCQNIMYGFKTNRQVTYEPSSDSANFRTRHQRENPQVLGLALTVHHDTRNKQIVNLLSAHNYCVPYSRTMLLETSLANAVVESTRQFQGLYVPPFLKRGTFVFFAADNADFAEDTPDGKGTTHGTITAVYQKADAPGEPISSPLHITDAHSRSVTPYHVSMLPCGKPKRSELLSHNKDRITEFSINKTGVEQSYQLTHLGWVVANTISRMRNEEELNKIPGWAGYNSLLSRTQPVTQVGALPLLPELAHEWSTLLTVMMQARKIKELAVGNDYPTVISFDLALYEKVVQLLDSRPDLQGQFVPRMGELHVVMAALRALGTSIENSGIDDAWMEADVYGPATTRQILKCTHYKRSLRAHIYSYIALYEIVLEEFFKENQDLKEVCFNATAEIQMACSEKNKSTKAEAVKSANTNLLETMTDEDMMKKFQDWEAQRSKNAMFKSMMNYLHRVETILFFVAASRTADLKLHLEAGEALSKLFFAMDRIKYKRLWPRYISDMYALKTNHPETWRELESGNISVTKSDIPFVSIGADNGCEQVNLLMKVHNGLTGISNDANARQRFFLTAPELSCMAGSFKAQFGLKSDEVREHHDLAPNVIKREHATISKIKAAIMSHGNPFAVENDHTIYNLITHAYVPEQYVSQILNIDDIGQKLYEDYVTERINGDVSIWAPVKKEKNLMYMSGNKKSAVKVRDKTVDLKETKDLYGRLMVLARSSRDIDLKHAIGNYEFTLTPRALFAPSGSMLPCTDKSKLIHVLEKLPQEEPSTADPTVSQDEDSGNIDPTDPTVSQDEDAGNIDPTIDLASTLVEDPRPSRKIAVVDGMVVVQKLTKPSTVYTVKDLSESFNDRLMRLTRDYDEIILVFDTYKPNSLKSTTREKRRQGKDPIQYQIRDDTNIRHVTMSRFLSHDQTKAALTEYLAEKTLDYNRESSKLVIVSASGRTRSNSDLVFEDNNHEEADTLMICLAVSASERSPDNAELTIFSPDTDVLVLAVANYDLLLNHTSISMASGVLQIRPIWTALGADKAKALPTFHAFTGADNTGRFSRVGKTTWFKIFLKADGDAIRALQMLSENIEVTEDLISTLASFVCAAYCPKSLQIQTIPEMRWYLFCKHMAESEKLPPTTGALKQHILRVRIQARVWGQASRAQQEFLDPLQNGFFKDANGQLKPRTTDVLPAPKSIVEMVRCECKTDCSSQRCSCKSENLPCTDICLCSTQCENDDDYYIENQLTDDESGSDDDA